MLVPCGHEATGKAGESYQRISILLAKNGIAALCYDPIGQGELCQLLDASGKPSFASIGGSTSEHTAVGIGALLVGRTVAGDRVWDGVRGLDYLVSRPEVDPTRIGCTGNSGGGTLTAYLMAFDDRIAVAAPSCYITSLERLFATIGPQDGEQNLPGQVVDGIEHADFATMRAPKPTLLCVGTRDFFDIKGSWDTFQEVKRVYCKSGFGERVDLFESDEPHGFTKPRREATVRWMRRWFYGKDDAVVEHDFPIGKERDLRCTTTGQVLIEFHGRSAFDLNAEAARALEKRRLDSRPQKQQLVQKARQLSGFDAENAVAGPAKLIPDGSLKREAFEIEKFRVGSTLPNSITAVRFTPPKLDRQADAPLVIVIGGDRTALAGAEGLIEREVNAGRRVVHADLRGMGELAPGGPGASKGLGAFGVDWKEAFLGMHLNRPLLGQRTFDVVALLNAFDAKGGVHLIGIESVAPIALHAAAFDSRITQVTLERPVISWTSAAMIPAMRGELANVVPGVLKAYDLNELAATLAPRPLTIHAAHDPTGKPVSQMALDATYEVTRAAYHTAGAEAALVLKAEP